MQTFKAATFAKFVQEIERMDDSPDMLLFRGQTVRGNLLPSICRENPSIDTTKAEEKMLSELRRMGSSLVDDSRIGDWDLLVMAQHFGMKTRLLDWTSNPMAALWFACSSRSEGNAYVYVLSAGEYLSEPKEGPFTKGPTRIYQPTLNNPRIIAQHGWFTAHKYSPKVNGFVPLEKNTRMNGAVVEMTIQASSRSQMIKSLDRNGVNSRTLFPDLEGLCRYLNWRQQSR